MITKLIYFLSENVKKSKSLDENVFEILDKMEALQNKVWWLCQGMIILKNLYTTVAF